MDYIQFYNGPPNKKVHKRSEKFPSIAATTFSAIDSLDTIHSTSSSVPVHENECTTGNLIERPNSPDLTSEASWNGEDRTQQSAMKLRPSSQRDECGSSNAVSMRPNAPPDGMNQVNPQHSNNTTAHSDKLHTLGDPVNDDRVAERQASEELIIPETQQPYPQGLELPLENQSPSESRLPLQVKAAEVHDPTFQTATVSSPVERDVTGSEIFTPWSQSEHGQALSDGVALDGARNTLSGKALNETFSACSEAADLTEYQERRSQILPDVQRSSHSPFLERLDTTMSPTEDKPPTPPMTSSISPMIFHLSTDDTLFYISVAKSYHQVEKLFRERHAWKLPPTDSTHQFNVISANHLGEDQWVVVAKLSCRLCPDKDPADLDLANNFTHVHSRYNTTKKRNRGDLTTDDGKKDNRAHYSEDLPQYSGAPKRLRRSSRFTSREKSTISISTSDKDKELPPRRHRPWTAGEDRKLNQLIHAGLSWSQIKEKFPQRTGPAVQSHWVHLMKQVNANAT